MSRPEAVRNIIFDFGGVLLDLDYNMTYLQMEKVLGYAVAPGKISPGTSDLLYGYEKGLVTTDSMIKHMQSLSKLNPTDNDIINAWNAMLLGWQTYKFALLASLRKNFRVYLLSNTNELHLDWVYNDLLANHGITDFETRFFDKAYYSHQIHCRKPDADIYRYVTEDAGLIPHETLFIDDLAVNIAAAVDEGWHTWHFDPADDLKHTLTNRLGLNLHA